MIARIRKSLDEKEQGFTLVELLVVVIIIGILAAIAIPVFLNQRQRAWAASVEADLKNAAIAAETYGVDHNGSYDGLTTADLAGLGYKKTEGVTVTVDESATDATHFVLTGKHASLTGSDDTWTYDSNNGVPLKAGESTDD